MFVNSPISRRRTAAVTVETAVVLPTLLMMILAIFDFGHYFLSRHMLMTAASQAGRAAIAGASTRSTEELRQLARHRLLGAFDDNVEVNVYQIDELGNQVGPWQDAEFGERICVEINANFKLLTPLFGILPNQFPLHAKSIQLSEGD